jgi:nucleotide-binding universal stress UspA family protein
MQRYTHILVPLDGSQTAEAALPHGFALAQLSGAPLTLLYVVPPIEDVIDSGAEPIFIDEQFAARKTRALRYFDSIRKRPECKALTIDTAVEMGPVAATVVTYAAQHGVDVIVMATHGRSGLQRWLLGSVAEKILHAAHQTIVLVRAFPPPASPPTQARRRPVQGQLTHD